jgi:hypothetical protein
MNPLSTDNPEARPPRFAAATPFPHLVLDEFLEPELAAGLLDDSYQGR